MTAAAKKLVVDDKSAICIPFILRHLEAHRQKSTRPFFIGLNGIQGAGKTTLVSALNTTLQSPPYSLRTATLSIDDLYLTNAAQRQLASANKHNSLLQYRGEPGTHDLALGNALFSALENEHQNVAIPLYNKSAFSGQGDRADRSSWQVVNKAGEDLVQVVLFEGWCVGFRPLSDQELEGKLAAAKDPSSNGYDISRLKLHSLDDVKTINDALKGYDEWTNRFDAFIHIDAEDTHYVYDWRLEAEIALRAATGSGMTDEKIVEFVDGYYPAYELFTDTLRSGIFPDEPGKQLRLVVSRDRSTVSHEVI